MRILNYIKELFIDPPKIEVGTARMYICCGRVETNPTYRNGRIHLQETFRKTEFAIHPFPSWDDFEYLPCVTFGLNDKIINHPNVLKYIRDHTSEIPWFRSVDEMTDLDDLWRCYTPFNVTKQGNRIFLENKHMNFKERIK